uniref:Protein translocase subunit SecD n=1 Tax=candidate division WOR-3 bacterium TaxID=2052148 RepID=A0A7C4G9A8_UNCW3
MKFGLIFLLLVAGIYVLIPTFRLHILLPAQERALAARRAEATTPEALAAWQKDSMHLHEQKAALYAQRILSLGLDLVGGMDLALEVDKSRLTEEQAAKASERALEVIRNRIDQFGVFEPVVQRTEQGRILVQLPGVDRDRAISIIKQPAHLTLQLVEDKAKTYDALKAIEERLQAETGAESTAVGEEAEPGTLLSYVESGDEMDLMVAARDTGRFRGLLEKGRPYWPQGFEFLFGPVEPRDAGRVVRVYMLKAEPELVGSTIKKAEPTLYQGQDLDRANTWVVDFELDREGAAKFAAVTSRNVGRRLAIVLDRVVRSAPRIQERIPNGRAQITTYDRRGDKTKDLAIVLNSGALPAPVKVVEERAVSASLGRDSIRRGIQAALVGCLAVVVFMLLYYAIGGLLADLALVFNLFLLLAVLAAFRATLTLPGLAGIALTIGMAVDANVLVFERIREELRAGKTNLAAVDTGYSRAFVTIVDSNMTTILTAIALYFVGTGPIRGFAITLTAGLIINVVTAVFFTRWVFDWWLSRFSVKTLRV